MISVLYIDDEPELLDLCRHLLERTGDFKVETTGSPLDVPGLLKKRHFDAIICDYQMPDKDGISLLKEIRRDFGGIPFILLTGRGREEVVIDALNNGADFYLQKGVDVASQFAELASKVRQAILRHHAQESLRESEKLLFDIINFLPDPTFAINRKGIVITWNRAIETMTGVPARDMIGKGNYEYALPFYGERRPILINLIFEPDDIIRKNYTGITRENRVLVAETSHPRLQGEVRVLTARASPLYNQNGEITGAIESIRDITAQKRAEDGLHSAHEQLTASDKILREQYEELVRTETAIREKDIRLQELVSTIPGVVYQFFCRPGRIFGVNYVSDHSRDILGMEPEPEFFFEKFTSCIHPDDRNAFLASIDDVVTRAAPWHFEGRFIRPSGELIWIRAVSSPAVHGSELVYSGVVLDVTNRKADEAALIEEEVKYRTLVEHSQDAVFIVQDENLAFANKALMAMCGFSEENCVGRPIGELIAPEDREGVVARNRERMSGGDVPETEEFSLMHADGSSRILVRMKAGIANFRGRPAILGTFHDVTAERLREAALQASEQKYRELAELLPQTIFEMDAGLNLTFVNRNGLATFGFCEEDLRAGINALRQIDPSQHAIVAENIAKVVRGEPYESPEYTAIRKDKSTFPVRIYYTPIFRENQIDGFRGVIVDISAWKAEYMARKEIEARYSSLADAAQDLIYIIDRNDTVLYLNHYGLEMTGKTPDEIIGKPRRILFPEPAAALLYQSLQRVFSTGNPFRIESSIPLRERETWQDTHLVPLKAADGTVTAILGISRDITQLKQAEVAVKRSNEKLNLLNSITRHDVANQLTILNGYIQLARMKESDPVIGDFLKKIQGSSSTIQRQIEFTRTYQDLGIRAPGWFRLSEILARTRPAGLAFTTVCNNGEIFADPMLEKVFFNLFDNAVRHGERITSISIRCEDAGDDLTIIVEDDGVGIPLDLKQKIFEKGFGKNTGYGLFLVREILAITGIQIHETGRHGSGAKFEITVPKGGFRHAPAPSSSPAE